MSEDILFSSQQHLGIITLNRPKALNALTQEMLQNLQQQLNRWAVDDNIKFVLIHANDERAFCAGGDIRQVTEHISPEAALEFFRHEYRVNRTIQHYPKPYIALVDGITMGGGVGISQHGSHRFGGKNMMFAMPETGIGFFPDVGGSYFLPRLPGRVGWYLGLTGARIGLADSLDLGLCDAFIPREKWTDFISALSRETTLESLVDAFSEPVEPGPMSTTRDLIDRYFAGSSFAECWQHLQESPDPWCQKTVEILQKKSPTSLLVTWEQLKKGAKLNFDACMQQEFRMVYRFLQGTDFPEGVRAAIIDKDQNPKWSPSEFKAISQEIIASYFAALPSSLGELTFD